MECEELFAKFREEYIYHRKISILQYFTDEDLEKLKLLGIEIENKLYTEHEVEILLSKVFDYFDDDEIILPEDKYYYKELPQGINYIKK